jgi:hypothetical protein
MRILNHTPDRDTANRDTANSDTLSRDTSDRDTECWDRGSTGFDPRAAFADPVAYLASHGIEARLVAIVDPELSDAA